MITRLGEVEEGEAPKPSKSKTEKVMSLYTAKVVLRGSRYGQVVEVVERRRGGEVVCVFEGQRFAISESGLEKVTKTRRRPRRKKKST